MVIGVFSQESYPFPIGLAFMRDLTFPIGLANVRSNIPQLARLIESGRLDPRPLISHRLALDETAHGYRIFDARADSGESARSQFGPATETAPGCHSGRAWRAVPRRWGLRR